jgi:arsenate reductase (thioredoxin)
MNILVLCTGNSARSILLESILNHSAGGRLQAWSAGSNPAGQVHAQSLALLTDLGHDTTGLRSKSWDEFAAAAASDALPVPPAPATHSVPVMDLVITVCGSAAGETCPFWPGAPLRAHWGVEDPAAVTGADQKQAFQTAYDILNRRALALLTLLAPGAEQLIPSALQRELNRIGELP